TTALPDYPFRDDALASHDAIFRFVDAYVRLYYCDDDAVAGDPEVKAWVAELRAEGGGRIKGIAGERPVETVEALAALVTQIIFRVTTSHASINYPCFDAWAYVPGSPAVGYRPAPSWDREPAEDELRRVLAPLPVAWALFDLAYTLREMRLSTLGD